MAEYLCPITNNLCPRPGEEIPGGSDISNEGYCGGNIIYDNVCPIIFETSSMIENEYIRIIRMGSTNVSINRRTGLLDAPLYIIHSGRQIVKTENNLPDFPDLYQMNK